MFLSIPEVNKLEKNNSKIFSNFHCYVRSITAQYKDFKCLQI